MQVTHTKLNHTDDRGDIRDILAGEEVDAVTYISYTKGAVRANHFHEQSVQWDYILTGSLECYMRDGFEGEITKVVVGPGDLVHHPIGEHHALRALEDATTLSLTKGPRRGKDYEKDVIRLVGDQKLI